jgi:hypothetical protein
VHDGFRAAVLAGAVVVGAALLLKRNGNWPSQTNRSESAGTPAAGSTARSEGAATGFSAPSEGPGAGSGTAFSATSEGPGAGSNTGFSVPSEGPGAGSNTGFSAPSEGPGAGSSTAPFATAGAPASAGGGSAATSASAGQPLTEPLAPTPPNYTPPTYTPPSYTPPGAQPNQAGSSPPGFAPPTSGYRPPFAPHGPWAGSNQSPYANNPPQAKAPKAPKPPRERSKLGRITFFAVLFVLGMLALIDLAGVSVAISAYFAAALATIALGLILGAWIGRARGLIFLALLAALGLGVASGTEHWGGQVGNNVYRPQSLAAVADRYDFSVGNATLDLRAVNFANATQDTTIVMKVGQVKVMLPDNVDTTASVDLENGRAQVLGHDWEGNGAAAQDVTDLGADGAGGGTLHLNIQMNAGNVEVTR